MSSISLENDLYKILQKVKNPGRYVGGEYGALVKEQKRLLRFALCFPDLYEIGMSNNAIRILYSSINSLDNVACERVFAVEKEFSIELEKNNIPLYTLESKWLVKDCDILGFSVGYELSATTILKVLEDSHIPIDKNERSNTDPIVIAGGPAITNPLPFSSFFDAVFIGEADLILKEVLNQLSKAKEKGADREDLISIIRNTEGFWYFGKKEITKKMIYGNFNNTSLLINNSFPVPSIKTVQDHGVIEIMRGCPNGCRFCHAGYYYRQKREKNIEVIMNEVDLMICNGYRDVTLSSLSTGDYSKLLSLMSNINEVYKGKNISISLPSLKVDSFTLPLLKEISKNRKSGLTFAIESPGAHSQGVINKRVFKEQIIEILKNAKEEGWKLAKFYFMIGLPFTNKQEIPEEEMIINFIEDVQKNVGISLNINIGTFIPKPHTPFQWEEQLEEKLANERLRTIKAHFNKNQKIKVSYHDPFISRIEGIISRGDERVGDLIKDAYREGAYLDAWEEHLNRDVWKKAIESDKKVSYDEILKGYSINDPLPWDGIDIGVKKQFFKNEREKAKNSITTEICSNTCNHNCGICNKNVKIIEQKNNEDYLYNHTVAYRDLLQDEDEFPYLINYEKKDEAIYLGHIDTMTVFERALQRADINIMVSQGYNPKPKLTFAHPLMLGVSSESEYCMIINKKNISSDMLMTTLNRFLSKGFYIKEVVKLEKRKVNGEKGKSLMALYGGSSYKLSFLDPILFSSMYEIFNTYLSALGGCVEMEEEGVLIVYLPSTGKKDGNIKYYIEMQEKVPDFLSRCRITRINTYAKDRKNYKDVLLNIHR